MNKVEFIDEIKDILEIEDELTETTNLKDIPEYDSLAVMSIIAFVDENFDKSLTGDQLSSVSSVGSLITLIGEESFS